MAEVVIDMSISLDGYVAGPNDDKPGNALGDGGMVLHDWYFSGDTELDFITMPGGLKFKTSGVNTDIATEAFTHSGVAIFGRHTYDICKGWGGDFTTTDVVHILTHNAPSPEEVPDGPTTFTFFDDITKAVESAQEKCPDGKRIGISGGAPCQLALQAGLVDRIVLHVAPVLLGGGVSLFGELGKNIALENTRTVQGPGVTHHFYDVKK